MTTKTHANLIYQVVSRFCKEMLADSGLTPEYCGKRMRATRGKALETVPFQPYFGCAESFLKVLSN